MSPCVCIFREKRDSEWLILKGRGAVFNFSNSFFSSSPYFFTETCQLLYMRSVPFLLTISTCCQGVHQKAQVSFSHFINKTQSASDAWSPAKAVMVMSVSQECSEFSCCAPHSLDLSKCPCRAHGRFRVGFKKHALFSGLHATSSKSRIHFKQRNNLKAHLIHLVFVD